MPNDFKLDAGTGSLKLTVEDAKLVHSVITKFLQTNWPLAIASPVPAT